MWPFKKKQKARKIFYSFEKKEDSHNYSSVICPFEVILPGKRSIIRFPGPYNVGSSGCYNCDFNKEVNNVPAYNVNWDTKIAYVQCCHPLTEEEENIVSGLEKKFSELYKRK